MAIDIASPGASEAALRTALAALTNRTVNLDEMRPLSDFTQVGIGSTRTATEVSNKAITIKETGIDTTLRVVGIRRAMPSTTSRVAAYVQANMAVLRYGSLNFGFSDGTKFHTICFHAEQIEEQKWTTTTARSSVATLLSTHRFGAINTGYWIGMRVDATAGKAYFEYSSDGVNFSTVKAITMSSDHLAGAYTQAFVGLFAYQVDSMAADAALQQTSVSILNWDESGLTRTFA
jgi:hypothetical protein